MSKKIKEFDVIVAIQGVPLKAALLSEPNLASNHLINLKWLEFGYDY